MSTPETSLECESALTSQFLTRFLVTRRSGVTSPVLPKCRSGRISLGASKKLLTHQGSKNVTFAPNLKVPKFSALDAYFKIFATKTPYFNVLRQKSHFFNFATKLPFF